VRAKRLDLPPSTFAVITHSHWLHSLKGTLGSLTAVGLHSFALTSLIDMVISFKERELIELAIIVLAAVYQIFALRKYLVNKSYV
jgi:hypothetical protein